MTTIGLLLGKPPERSPVLPDVVAQLTARGARVLVHVPRADETLPPWLAETDVVALRGLRRPVLQALASMEAGGLRCCNTARSTMLTKDRTAMHRTLCEAGIPVPTATTVVDVDEARHVAAGRPVVVKVRNAERGAGTGVVFWARPEVGDGPAAPGPYLVQHWVPGDGVDRKLYVVGRTVGGLLKPWRVGRRSGTVFEPGRRLRRVAVEVGEALGLRIFGVDVVEGPDGPVVVDVNAFPSCDGLPCAAVDIAETLLASAEGD